MLLHVWVASWEIECCRPAAVIGERWGGSMILAPPEPSWRTYATTDLAERLFALEVSEFEGDVLRPVRQAEDAASTAVGSARIGVVGATTPGPQVLRGIVCLQVHGPMRHDELLPELHCEGTVSRVRGVQLDYDEDRKDAFVIGLEQPVDLDTTAGHGVGDPEGFPEFVVDLELE